MGLLLGLRPETGLLGLLALIGHRGVELPLGLETDLSLLSDDALRSKEGFSRVQLGVRGAATRQFATAGGAHRAGSASLGLAAVRELGGAGALRSGDPAMIPLPHAADAADAALGRLSLVVRLAFGLRKVKPEC